MRRKLKKRRKSVDKVVGLGYNTTCATPQAGCFFGKARICLGFDVTYVPGYYIAGAIIQED